MADQTIEIGAEIGPIEKIITDEAVAAFCEIWGSTPPNRFTDEDLAREVGLAGPIAPGVMTMGIMAQFLTGHVAKGSLRLLDLVFRQPVTHGTVSLKAVVTSERDENGERLLECDVHLSNEQQGNLVGGRAILALPRP